MVAGVVSMYGLFVFYVLRGWFEVCVFFAGLVIDLDLALFLSVLKIRSCTWIKLGGNEEKV